jgi:hypothetical protein
MVFGVPVPAKPRRPLIGSFGVGVFGVALEVGAGGVEEQQVDLEVEQVGDGEEHRLLHPGVGVGLDQQVHRPVGLVLVHPLEPGDRDVVGGPLRGGQLRGRVDGPVRDQREQHPLHIRGEPAPAEHGAQRGVDPEGLPQPVEQPRRSGRPRLDQPQPFPGSIRAGRGGRVGTGLGVGFAEVAVDRADQSAQPVGVESVLPPKVEQHVRPGRRAHPLVVRQCQVAHDRPILVPTRGRPQIHDRTRPQPVLLTQANTAQNVCPRFRAPQPSHNTLTSS